MKMYKKSDLTLINGLLVSDSGDIIMPGLNVVEQANDLETLIQKTEFLADQPDAQPMPSLDGFKRKSIKDKKVQFVAKTPLMDMRAMEAMSMMDELDDVATVNRANEMLAKFSDLLEFVDNDYVIDCGSCVNYVLPFDTPMLGSVLALTRKDIVSAVATACGMEEDELRVIHDCDDCDNIDCENHPSNQTRTITTDDMTDEEIDKLHTTLGTLFSIIDNHDHDMSKEPADDEGSEE